MNPERLLQHFDRIDEAPDAIPRLRRFILDLAVRGKLVDQDPNDEPASELLKRIQTEKARLAREGKIRKQQSLPQIEPDDVPFDLPENWEWTRLGEIGITQTGTTPSKNQGDNFGSYIPFIKPGDLYPNNVDYANEGLSESGLKDSDRSAPAGSLLMVCIGTIGKCQLIDRVCSFNQQINSLSPYVDLCSRYLLAACLSEYFQKSAWAASARTTIAILNKGKWELLLLPLPPLAEQHRIVAKVDELMALCDQLEAAKTEREQSRDRLVAACLHCLNSPADTSESDAPDAFRDHACFYFNHLPRLTTRPAHIKQLRQTILNLAVRGKLVPQHPNDESAAELLKRVEAEKERLITAGKIRKQQPLPKNQHGGRYSQIPPSWKAVELIDIVYLRSGIAVEHGDEMTEGHIPYVKVADLSLDANGNGIVTSSRFIGEKYSDSIIESGSIVFPKRGGAIATNRKRMSHVEIVCDSNLMAMKPFLCETTDYLQLWFSGFDLWKLNSGTSVPQINNKDIYPLSMPLPPLAEQHRIVAKVDELMALCDQLEAQLTTTEADSSRLLEAVLHEALAPALEEAA